MPESTANPHVPRPRDLDRATLRELVEGYLSHRGALVAAEHRVGEPEPIARLRGDALAELAIGEQIAQRMRNGRWATVRAALRYGATVEDVAAALDLTAPEVRAGVRSWADGQHRHGLMT